MVSQEGIFSEECKKTATTNEERVDCNCSDVKEPNAKRLEQFKIKTDTKFCRSESRFLETPMN